MSVQNNPSESPFDTPPGAHPANTFVAGNHPEIKKRINMTVPDYTTAFLVNRPANEVFTALNNVRGWWSEEIEGSTDKLNEVFDYHYQDVHRCKMKIVEMIPDRKVAWQVLENYFSFTRDKSEWTGNRLVFELTETDGKTHLQFTQVGLVPAYECYDICRNAWDTYIGKSLYNLITTGEGQPNGKDTPQTADEQHLSSPDFTTTFFVDQTPEEVFKAVINVRGWWQGEIEGATEQLNDEFTYRMKDFHYSRQRVTEIVPDKKVVWLVTDSRLNFLKQKDEWKGTQIIFEMAAINNKTQLRFTHAGLKPDIECYTACSNGWSKLIQESLRSLITTGMGKPVF